MSILSESALFGLPYWFYATLPIVALIGVAASAKVLNFRIISVIYLVLIITPAVSPVSAYVTGAQFFTLQNPGLQSDLYLNSKAILFVILFAGLSTLGMLRPVSFGRSVVLPNTRVKNSTRIMVFLFFFIMFVLFLESGNVITSAYADFKTGASPRFSSVVNQAFNVSAAILIADWTTKQKHRINLFFIILFISFCLLVARRTLALGLLLVLVSIISSGRISMRTYFYVGIGFLLLAAVGTVRGVGLIELLSEGDFRERSLNVYYLPGGASNIYMSLLATIDLREAGGLPGFFEFGPWDWFAGQYEGAFLKRAYYDYNGGFFIVSLVYFHLGVFGILLFGYLLGVLVRKADNKLSRLLEEGHGGWPASVAIGFLLVLPNMVWYHPIGTLKLFAAITFGYILMALFSSGASSVRTRRSR
ncbi:hypothetical protein P1J78_23065 [Psychromarinibacter sp. C21-152]|uniref:Uncharacterized protein n=1 Tax=Psychromarinibacter sediminicola TaxID=3033385 RepID=A0AAE3NXU0_9RHOB|nr:hypothetical protein [Psychromarinibacter sediminicola]MDF0603614.1 hypothetical protein [Psychromarinibacter sediminicola]